MILSLNPTTGLSGDMLLAALIDLGAPTDAIRTSIASTGLTGWELEVRRVTRHGLTATRVEVRVADDATERRATELITMAARATPAPVAAIARTALTLLAETEGRIHGTDPATVHLHELGGHDTLVDLVGAAAAAVALDIARVHSTALPLGSGTVRTRHGVLPVPAPATAALLADAQVCGSDLTGELVTPTGAVLLRALSASYDPAPPVRLVGTGYGAGSRELPDRANVLQALLGVAAGTGEHLVLLETNVDDVSGELLGHTIEALLAAGAADAWTSPVVMKKGRPAHVLHVLVDPQRTDGVEALIYAETATLGVRRTYLRRTAAPRHTTTVDVRGHRIAVKHSPAGAKPEYDHVSTAAKALGLPYRQVATLALRAASSQPLPYPWPASPQVEPPAGR